MDLVTNKFKYKQEVICYKDGSKFHCNGYAIGMRQDYDSLLVAIKRPNSISHNDFEMYNEVVQGVDLKAVMTDFPDQQYSFWAFDPRRIELTNCLENILKELEDETRS